MPAFASPKGGFQKSTISSITVHRLSLQIVAGQITQSKTYAKK
jgi:hypothetical protein